MNYLESATAEELIDELTSRSTWLGIIIGSEHKQSWTEERNFKVSSSDALKVDEIPHLLEEVTKAYRA